MSKSARAAGRIAFADGYQPGVCNIGSAEIGRRRLAAAGAVIAVVGVAAFLVVSSAPPIARFLLVIPLYGAAVSVYQAWAKFCVGFAMSGLANFGAIGGQTRIEDEAARRADRRKAIGAIARCGAIALVISAGFALLPL